MILLVGRNRTAPVGGSGAVLALSSIELAFDQADWSLTLQIFRTARSEVSYQYRFTSAREATRNERRQYESG